MDLLAALLCAVNRPCCSPHSDIDHREHSVWATQSSVKDGESYQVVIKATAPPFAPLNMSCWACNVLVQVPFVDAAPAAVFKCGWCGALTDTLMQQRVASEPYPLSPVPVRLRPLLRRAKATSQTLLVGVVTLVILGIAAASAVALLPRLCGASAARWALLGCPALLLLLNVLFNYAASVATAAGSVAQCVALPRRPKVPPQGCMDNWEMCPQCRFFKPPGTHHCRSCRTCVVGMDHHCIMINNCVGRANMRVFILFLFWAFLGLIYVTAASVMVLHQGWPDIVSGMHAAAVLRPGDVFPTLGWRLLLGGVVLLLRGAPWWALTAAYLVGVGGSLSLGLGVLLGTTLRYVARGRGYVAHLKAVRAAAAEAALLGGWAGAAAPPPPRPCWGEAWANVHAVMSPCGGGNGGAAGTLAWLLPRWRPPAGILAGGQIKKVA